jgi:superfamily II DNA or RNA helicase
VIELRDYQHAGLGALRSHLGQGKWRLCLVAPTGAGKTTIAAAMIKGAVAKGKRVLFLAHRKELIEQCSARLDLFEIPHGIIQRKHKRTDPRRQVQVASIQTLIRRDHWDADLIIVDECHRSTSKTYRQIIDRYDEKTAVIGITATPYRMDGRGLGELYDELIDLISVQDLVDAGHLVLPDVYGSTAIDLSSVKTTAGDFDKKDLAAVMREVVFRGDVVDNWLRRVKDLTGVVEDHRCNACTVVFCTNVQQSIQMVEQFRQRGITAAHLDAKTPAKERAEVLRRLRDREISVVSNVGILTEGWDLPHLECVILLRPTRSRSLFKQMVGRIMRPDPDKRFGIVLDHANCTRMHGFVNEVEKYSLNGRESRPRKGAAPAPHKMCKACEYLLPLKEKQCPVCGALQFIVDVKFTDEELVKLDHTNLIREADVPEDIRQEAFVELCRQCVSREFKPNWASVRYMKIYGVWPTIRDGIRKPGFFRSYEHRFKKAQQEKQTQEQTSLLS